MTRNQRDFAELLDAFAPRPEQDEDAFCEAKADELVAAVRAIVDYHGHKVVAAALGRQSVATLTQAVKLGAGAHRHHVYLRELPKLIRMDPTGELLAAINSVIAEPWSEGEIATAVLELVNEEFGPETRKGFLSATERRLQRNRARAKRRGVK